ncbi:MAG: EpsI family protein [Nitrospira sp.]|nr:MAG: EpsI family protein [Nitrospira sp.]
MIKSLPLILSIIVLAGAWGLLTSLSHGEPMLNKRPFSEFPVSLAGHWKGTEIGMDQEILDVLKVSDYMLRMYQPSATLESGTTPASGHGPLWLYVGYYQSQRTGATYHSPKNCLPGAGWQLSESNYVSVPTPTGASATINRVVVGKGLERQLILYWYQDRGRIIASEYWAKAYMIWDAMTKNRTDGSLVRLSIPVTTSTEDAYREGMTFLQDAWPVLFEYLPTREMVS